MGCSSSKADEQQLRANYMIFKAYVQVKSSLRFQISQLRIKRSYFEFNPARREASVMSKSLFSQVSDLMTSIPMLKSNCLSEIPAEKPRILNFKPAVIDIEPELQIEIDRLMEKKILANERLRKIREVLTEKIKKVEDFREMNRLKGEEATDQQLLKTHVKAKNLSIVSIDSINLIHVPARRTGSASPKHRKNKQSFHNLAKLSKHALMLRSRLLLKEEMKKTVLESKKHLEKRLKVASDMVKSLESVSNDTNIQKMHAERAYLDLKREEHLLEVELNTLLKEKGFLESVQGIGKQPIEYQSQQLELLEKRVSRTLELIL
jgi:siroheme synthase (precorrin-2 oxidase/ferrochelatase)